MATPEPLYVFVEIPKGSRNKYEFDPELGRLVLDRTLWTSVVFPADYGYLMDTLGRDPAFDRALAQRTLHAIWSATAQYWQRAHT